MLFGQVIEVPEGVLLQQINDNDAVQVLHANMPQELTPAPALTKPEIPFFTFQTFASRDGNSYRGSMVGGSPFRTATRNVTTTVNVVIVPVVLNFNFSNGLRVTFSPTAGDPGCLGPGKTALGLTRNSPIFRPASFTMNGVKVGHTTYPDAFLRAEFSKKIGRQYHLHINVTQRPAVTVNLSASNTSPAIATVFQSSGLCGNNAGNTNPPGGLGVVDMMTFDPIARKLISNLHLNAKHFPLFLFYNAVMSVGDATNSNNCCVLGYHDSETGQVTNPGQLMGYQSSRAGTGHCSLTLPILQCWRMKWTSGSTTQAPAISSRPGAISDNSRAVRTIWRWEIL
jgi:hypothetical protein